MRYFSQSSCGGNVLILNPDCTPHTIQVDWRPKKLFLYQLFSINMPGYGFIDSWLEEKNYEI